MTVDSTWWASRLGRSVALALVGAVLWSGIGGGRSLAQSEPAGEAAAQPPPVFTEAMLSDQHNIDVGRGIWEEQCAHCHGAKSYPGKAPKLKPSRYKPDFVFYRVDKGFRAMPAWGEIYTREELIGIVAWVKSKQFSP